MGQEGSDSWPHFLPRDPEDQPGRNHHRRVHHHHVFPALSLMDKGPLAFLALFVVGVLIHQRFFADLPIVPTMVGVLGVAYLFNLVLGVTTAPAQIVRIVGHETLSNDN
jgi:hypothetical protein